MKGNQVMFLIGRYARRVALLSIAFGVASFAANAQQAKFNLPFEARWGSAVLQPGEYTLSIPMPTSGVQVITLTRPDKTVYILAASESLPQSEGSYLQVENIGAMHVVRELSLAEKGKSFTFEVPKSVREQVGTRQTAQENTKLAVLIRN